MWTSRVKSWIFSRHILVSRRKEAPLEMEKRKCDNTIASKNEEIQKVKQKMKKKKKKKENPEREERTLEA